SGPRGFAPGRSTTLIVSGGIAAFSNLVLDSAASSTLVASGPGGIDAPASTIFPLSALPVYHLAFSVQPGDTTAGGTISPTVQVKVLERFGNLLTADNTDPVTLSIASGPGGFAGGSTTTITASGGIATFSNLVLNSAGSYTLG